MFRVVERVEDAAADETVFVFKVYRSPLDKQSVFGYLEPKGFVTGAREVTWVQTDFGVPVSDAFRQVLQLAQRWQADVIRVDDPDKLFPPAARPA